MVVDDAALNKTRMDHANSKINDDLIDWVENMHEGNLFFTDSRISHGRQVYTPYVLNNLWFSSCYNCDGIAIWIRDLLLFPQRGDAPPANPDLPGDILQDYAEASAILDLSPRGAAALIRLAIQKLCKKLGKPGENINDDIGALVADGLSPKIQQALDYVRVIGNNAVHPGHIDIKDDRATAATLFHLLNMIAEKMISEPKHISQIYSELPEEARQAIQKRDGKK